MTRDMLFMSAYLLFSRGHVEVVGLQFLMEAVCLLAPTQVVEKSINS